MVNEFVYCPRLAYLMWAQGEWAETGDTVEGRRIHAQVDRPGKPLATADDLETGNVKAACTSLTLGSEELGVIAKIDLVEAENGVVTPIDYKRGKRPHLASGAYQPERVQVCLQAMLLEEHGYQVEEGAIWYAESRERVRIKLDPCLRQAAVEAVNGLRMAVSSSTMPPPLEDSPKCPRCALVSICLPDETNRLRGLELSPRPIAVSTDDALPLIIQSQGVRVKKQGETLKIVDEKQGDTVVRINEISDVALFGNIQITSQALKTLMNNEIPVAFHSYGGWLQGIAQGIGHRNAEIRTAQYRNSFDEKFCLAFSRDLVTAKITNQRTIVRRNWKGDEESKNTVLIHLNAMRKHASLSMDKKALLGFEGNAAMVYFQAFANLLTPPSKGSNHSMHDAQAMEAFCFRSRNRRPPKDPVNALLSFGYAMLTRHCTAALALVGLDPYRGLFHTTGFGKPALALDIMEPFRPIIADSVVLSVVNTGEISAKDFVSSCTGTALKTSGRRKFIQAFERRMLQETTHPLFTYRLSMRRLLIMQARLLSRHLLGELAQYPHYLPR